eukprot:CAMPEP_0181170358 /NCGR_PEP_ID=MMETSP1096-20121128/1320_1 /TAXON_ID=156174 ORGANISM="Chrysochromulina ericina, Strain CCMP281" /NCGR_SAMPLE_ID=MMETSP1096 /ASSEMBLY_ACC=CAM_ASM_000453 /LENGTH=87 /DNA_ID=CAMNT_0023257907 /DNA_START=322 /DNA_END=585 /DNA_ORIENTATION=-
MPLEQFLVPFRLLLFDSQLEVVTLHTVLNAQQCFRSGNDLKKLSLLLDPKLQRHAPAWRQCISLLHALDIVLKRRRVAEQGSPGERK